MFFHIPHTETMHLSMYAHTTTDKDSENGREKSSIQNGKCHMSRVTCHVSHVMCHLSPINCHLSLMLTATATDPTQLI